MIYFLAIVIGIVLGFMGSGGSILTLPVLVYIGHFSPVEAIPISLVVVGIAALSGAIQQAIKGHFDFRAVWQFTLPSLLAVSLTRKYLFPAIPQEIWGLSKDGFLMYFFAFLVMASAMSMLVKKKTLKTNDGIGYFRFYGAGLLTGLITGMVGAGAGFIIVPALVIAGKLPLKTAMGSSLLIISINCLGGLVVQPLPKAQLFILIFSGLIVGGSFVGVWLNNKIDAVHLKKYFGYFLLLMSVLILIGEWKK
ncbi:MAG: sulfite exporter TauE/SafE family protein [Bacteroidota bacterium]|jgi:uncharacterized membrane protein YfcA